MCQQLDDIEDSKFTIKSISSALSSTGSNYNQRNKLVVKVCDTSDENKNEAA